MSSCAYPHYRGDGCSAVSGANEWAAQLFARRTREHGSRRGSTDFPLQNSHLAKSCPTLRFDRLLEWARLHWNFTRTIYPAAAHSLPLVYPLSGADLLTAWSLFPEAPSFNLFSEFPPGPLACFTSVTCRQLASEQVAAYFLQWCVHSWAWTAPDDQRRWFMHSAPADTFGYNNTKDGLFLGTLPILIFMLHLMGHRITGLSAADPHGYIRGTIISTNRSIVTYAGGFLGDDRAGRGGMVQNSTLMAAHLAAHSGWQMPTRSSSGQEYPAWRRQLALLHHTLWLRHANTGVEERSSERPFLFMFKAAPTPFLKDPMMGDFLTKNAAAVIQDDLSIHPGVYAGANASSPFKPWVYTCFGKWAPFGGGSRAEYALQRVVSVLCSDRTHRGQGSELDFQWGYGVQKLGPKSLNGTLIAAWREELGGGPPLAR